jgi:hypothetical protein
VGTVGVPAIECAVLPDGWGGIGPVQGVFVLGRLLQARIFFSTLIFWNVPECFLLVCTDM